MSVMFEMQDEQSMQKKAEKLAAGYNYRLTYFTPDELNVDMTIDEGKIQTLLDSIRECGSITEPITVWYNDGKPLISNGMHRSYCAKLLKDEIENLVIPAIVIDCDEQTFRELRVLAASPHVSIKPARISQWVKDAWLASEHGKDASASLLSSAYGVYLKKGKFNNPEIGAWFERASKLWGMHIDQIARIVLGDYRTEAGKKIANEPILKQSIAYDLSIAKHSMLVDNVETVGRKGDVNDEKTIGEYIKREIIPITDLETPKSFKQFLSEKYKRKPHSNQVDIDETKKSTVTTPDIDIVRWSNTANGADNFTSYLAKLQEVDFTRLFSERPASKKKIDEMLAAAEKVKAKVYPDFSESKSLLSLMDENKKLKDRITQLEVISRESAKISISRSNLALSSADIENSG